MFCFTTEHKSSYNNKIFYYACHSLDIFLFWKLWQCLNIVIKTYSFNLKEIFMCIYLHAKNQLYHSLLSYDIAKKQQTCYFGHFGHIWSHTNQTIVSIWRDLLCLSASKKVTSSFTFSLRYCNDIAKLLLLVLWGILATHT